MEKEKMTIEKAISKLGRGKSNNWISENGFTVKQVNEYVNNWSGSDTEKNPSYRLFHGMKGSGQFDIVCLLASCKSKATRKDFEKSPFKLNVKKDWTLEVVK